MCSKCFILHIAILQDFVTYECSLLVVSCDFCFPGTLNNINIWEHSSLFESMISKEHDELEFDFPVDGEVFSKLYYLVEGIYQQVSCPQNPTLTQNLPSILQKTKKHTERISSKVLES